MRTANEMMYSALKVLTETTETRAYLSKNDPQALRQAERAITAYDEEDAERSAEAEDNA